MPLYNSKKMLLKAQDGRYAVGAFNIENLEMAMAVVSAAEELNAPVILQTTPSTLKYAAPSVFYGMVSALAKKASVPVVLHLDHGSSTQLCYDCIVAGYTSIMMDGSKLPFEENISVVRQVKSDISNEISLEAELGTIGGKEDQTCSESCIYTDPYLAQQFVKETGVDSLAIAIGTAHGFYKGEPKLDFERLEACRKMVSVPLVLHGASGVPDEKIKIAVSLGICKINFATELRVAFTAAVRESLADSQVFDPKVCGRKAMDSVAQLVKKKMMLCGCVGMAGSFAMEG